MGNEDKVLVSRTWVRQIYLFLIEVFQERIESLEEPEVFEGGDETGQDAN